MMEQGLILKNLDEMCFESQLDKFSNNLQGLVSCQFTSGKRKLVWKQDFLDKETKVEIFSAKIPIKHSSES